MRRGSRSPSYAPAEQRGRSDPKAESFQLYVGGIAKDVESRDLRELF